MKKKCLICKTSFLDFLDLGKHPCADTFLNNKNLSLNLKRIILRVGYCRCSHLTAIYPVSSYERYQKHNYSYTSSNSPVSQKHFKYIAKYISNNFKIKKNSFIIEAGCNDGTFLKEIKKITNCRILGIDPSKNICVLAKKNGIQIENKFFNSNSSQYISSNYGKSDVFYAANVFNHVDDNFDFLDAVSNVLKPDGVLILEVPDLESLIKKVGFDTIYHEHRHYYSANSIKKILNLKNFYIKKIVKINYMAGSLRVFAYKTIAKNKNIINKSNTTSVNLRDFKIFKKKVSAVIAELKKFVDISIKQGYNVYGIGAATKGNTLLNCCNFNYKSIKFILENSRYKIGKYTPGSAIKIISEKKIEKIQRAIILPWNITNHLINKLFKNKKNSYISIPKALKKIK
jgi:2-polyprenyl-3-methyl-5-hydroxy-6-metoxy-1,4-benzoquinol methylase